MLYILLIIGIILFIIGLVKDDECLGAVGMVILVGSLLPMIVTGGVYNYINSTTDDKLTVLEEQNQIVLSQIEPFITRKVRLHDGEVVLDEKVSEVGKAEETKKEKGVDKNNWQRALSFSMLNIVSQPKKSFLLL